MIIIIKLYIEIIRHRSYVRYNTHEQIIILWFRKCFLGCCIGQDR